MSDLRQEVAAAIAKVRFAAAPGELNPPAKYLLDQETDAVMCVVEPIERTVETLRGVIHRERADADALIRDAAAANIALIRERDEALASVEHLRGDYRRIRKDRDRLLLAWRSARRRANAWRAAATTEIPRWDEDAVVRRLGFLQPDQCGKCGEVNPRLTEALWLHAEAVWQRDQTLPEWQCPGCGATTRARMADHPTEQDGAAQIAAERRRVVTAEGYDAAHDDQHTHGELLDAARCYANQGRTTFQPFTYKYGTDAGALLDQGWPWWTDDRPNGWKPSSNPVRSLVKAGQFIAAEIDRLVRAAGAS